MSHISRNRSHIHILLLYKKQPFLYKIDPIHITIHLSTQLTAIIATINNNNNNMSATPELSNINQTQQITPDNTVAKTNKPKTTKKITKKITKSKTQQKSEQTQQKSEQSEQKSEQTEQSEQKSEVEKEKKPTEKKVKLPAKYAKFIHFAYYIADVLKQANPDIDLPSLHQSLNVFHDPTKQIAFVESFIHQENTIAESIKQQIKDTNIQNKKTNLLITKLVAKINRSKNVTHTLTENGTVSSILFNKKNPCTDPLLLASPLVKQALLSHSTHDNDIVAHIVTAANTNTTNTTNTTNNNNNDNTNTNDNDNDIEVTLTTINQEQYLIDKNNTIYHPQNHNPIATYNPTNHTINYHHP